MAFELLTDVCPRRTTKWSQMPDMQTGEDLWSWRTETEGTNSPFLRADDFISDGRLITDIHWWGSYSNWYVWIPGSETDPFPPPSDPILRPLGFNLSWHPEAGCVPGPELASVFVGIEECQEMYYGTVIQFWKGAEVYEHEYQYYVDLLALGEPWPEEKGGHYWLNIEAVFTNAFYPGYGGEGHYGWGWEIAEPIEPVEDGLCPPAVTSRDGAWYPDPGSLPPSHPRFDPSNVTYEMSFELTTAELSTNSPTLPIVITNTVSETSNTVHIIKSAGTAGAGVQYLQMSTNLLTNVWTDIPGQVKAVPFPPPIVNTWTVAGVTDSNVLYRVNEK
jgi:hypothetical protein